MTERAPDPTLAHPLQRQHRAHTRSLLVRHALRAAAAAAAVIAASVLIGTAFLPGVGGAWTRLLLVLAACLALALAAASRFARARFGLEAYLEHVEERFPAVRSWLRNAIDLRRRPAAHTSPALAEALDEETRRRLADVPLARLRPPVAPARPALAMVLAALVLVLGAFLWPARVSRSWATLWNPGSAAPPVRLAVEPGSVTLTPGASLAVRARVWGATQAPRLMREGPGVTAVAEGAEEGARVWRFDLTQLTRPEDYRVRVADVESPRYRIALSGEPAPVGFEVEYHAPAYARLPVQRGAAARGDLVALRGTRARLTVTFDRDLEMLEAELPGRRTSRWTEITPRRWRGEVPIQDDGEYRLHAVSDRSGAAPGEGRYPYRITAIADAPPLLAVRIPEGDVDLPAGQQIPVDVLAQDDLGLSELRLQFRKDPAAPWVDLPLGRFGSRPREARVESRWDASPLGLLPGETATFRFELFDDNAVSGRGRAVSPVFELRFPSLADLYERVDQDQADVQTTLERAADQARELQKTLDKMARQQPPRPNAAQSPQAFERSQELERALDRQQKIADQVSEATEQMRQSVEEAAERQAFDEQLTRKLREMSELMKQIESKEFKDAMKKMQDALEKLDRSQLDQELPKWREENQEMLSNLERTIELLKKLREEEKLQSLAQRAEELKAQQDELNREHESKESPNREDTSREDAPRQEAKDEALAERQQEAARESDQLAEEVRQLAEEMSSTDPQSDAKQDMESAADEMSEGAAPQQREAAESAKQQKRSKAGQSGRKASESLQKAAERLGAVSEQMQQEQDGADLAAVRRAAQDLVSLQRAAERNMASDATARDKGDRQTDLSEGTSRVADSLFNLAKQSPFITPSLAEALGRAINGLSQSGRDLASGNRARGEQAGRVGSESLNEAVLELRSAEGAMCENPGQGKPGGKSNPNPRRLGNVGQRQSQLNRESQSLAQRLSRQMSMSSGDRQELERMAQEQARIRQELEEIRRSEEERRELLGKLDQVEREMQDVEEILRDGSTDGTLEEKQNRIMSRLLDAQRSINRRDFDPQRESKPGEDVVRESPPELPREMLRENDRLRHDLLKAEADRYPAQYRALVEAYLRSLNGARR